MYRKVLRMSLLLTTALLLASCRQDPGVPKEDETVEVSFTMALPGGASSTKAISDGLGATTLLLYAYDANGKYLPTLTLKRDDAFATRTATATLKLVKGMTYNFIFVAVHPSAITPDTMTGTVPYTVSPETKSFRVDYRAFMANEDICDLFTTCLQDFKVTDSFTKEITLTRPLAQVNVGVTAEDLAVAAGSGIKVDEIQSALSFSNAGAVYDMFTQQVTENADMEVNVAARLRPVDEDLTVGTDTYKYMSMAYLLVPMDGLTADNRAVLDEVQLSLAVETLSGAKSKLPRSVPNVPVQKNYRTNIIGNIFGVDGVFRIFVDQRFVGDIDPSAPPKTDSGSSGEPFLWEWDGTAPSGNESFGREEGQW